VYLVDVTNESNLGPFSFNLIQGNDVVSGPHTIGPQQSVVLEVPVGTNGVRVDEIGDWRNTGGGAATTPQNQCPPATTTTTTTAPPPASVTSGGITAADRDTVVRGVVWNITGSRQVCTTVQVTGASSTPREWALRVDLRAAPWYGSPPSRIDLNGTGTVAVENQSSIRITGRARNGGPFDPRSNNTPITNAQTALVTICNYNAPVPPPADGSWYRVTTTQGTWTDTQACVVVTVATTRTDLATSPFFYGWTTTVDLRAAKARITGSGRTLNFVSWTPFPSGPDNYAAAPATYQPPLDIYTLTSGFDLALRPTGGGADSRTVTACVIGF
jgi:hypothetical protein